MLSDVFSRPMTLCEMSLMKQLGVRKVDVLLPFLLDWFLIKSYLTSFMAELTSRFCVSSGFC